MANILKIRAHHLLYLQGFQGYSYSQEFIKNMIEITKNIDSNSESQIISECDIICSCCSYNVEGVCQKRPDSAQKVKDMDMRVLRELNCPYSSGHCSLWSQCRICWNHCAKLPENLRRRKK